MFLECSFKENGMYPLLAFVTYVSIQNSNDHLLLF